MTKLTVRLGNRRQNQIKNNTTICFRSKNLLLAWLFVYKMRICCSFILFCIDTSGLRNSDCLRLWNEIYFNTSMPTVSYLWSISSNTNLRIGICSVNSDGNAIVIAGRGIWVVDGHPLLRCPSKLLFELSALWCNDTRRDTNPTLQMTSQRDPFGPKQSARQTQMGKADFHWGILFKKLKQTFLDFYKCEWNGN